MAVPLLLVALAAAARANFLRRIAEETTLVFAGAAGCDADDSGCARETPAGKRQVWVYKLTPDGSLRQHSSFAVPGLPAWLEWDPRRPRCLFAALVTEDSVAAFEITQGSIVPRGIVPSGGVNPVHTSLAREGAILLAANYHGPDNATTSRGASVASFEVAGDCTLAPVDVAQLAGSSVVKGRQDSAHPHSIQAPLDGQLAYACDLGQDLIIAYAVDARGSLRELRRTRTPPGDGPRHLVQHPVLPIVYVVNELASSIRVFEVGYRGALSPRESFSTVPPGSAREGTKASEIAISADGRTVYVSNRGRLNDVCSFDVLQDGTVLRWRQEVPVAAFPRGMALAPDGSELLVAGQHLGVLQTVRLAGGTMARTRTNVTGPPTAAALAVAKLSFGS